MLENTCEINIYQKTHYQIDNIDVASTGGGKARKFGLTAERN